MLCFNLKGEETPSQDCSSSVADIVFVVDSSGSIRNSNVAGEPDNWGLLLDFVNNMIDRFPMSSDGSQNRVALVEFGNEGILIFDFDDHFDKATTQQEVADLPFLDANTNTSGGLYVVLSQLLTADSGNRQDVNNFVIVITDGKSTHDSELTIPYARELYERADTTVFSVGITNG